ncbi:OGDH [Mytilus edulis]|uniref:OGDH n=1 Tax=Mytilus edulis TaxID=6550 RepID=A0A8S3UBY9_MYTED|nr:OGDH [Mytilus edulis]
MESQDLFPVIKDVKYCQSIFLDSLEAFETYTFDFIVTEARPLYGQIYIIFSTPEGTETRLQVNMQFSINKPLLVFTPATLNDTIVRGTQKILEVNVHNEGKVAAKNVTVSLPNDSRLSLVCFATVGSLDSNVNNYGITIAPNENSHDVFSYHI